MLDRRGESHQNHGRSLWAGGLGSAPLGRRQSQLLVEVRSIWNVCRGDREKDEAAESSHPTVHIYWRTGLV